MSSALVPLLALAIAAGGPARNARPSPADGSTAAQAPVGTAGAGPGAAAPEGDAAAVERVKTYLSSIDTPIPAERWRALGPAAVPALEAVLRDPEELPSRRARAVSGLAAIGGERAREAVLERLRAGDEEYAVRASAVRAAPHLVKPAALGKELGPVLEHAKDLRLRATAADVLARHAPRQGCGAVRAQAARERGEQRSAFGDALSRCGGGSP